MISSRNGIAVAVNVFVKVNWAGGIGVLVLEGDAVAEGSTEVPVMVVVGVKSLLSAGRGVHPKNAIEQNASIQKINFNFIASPPLGRP